MDSITLIAVASIVIAGITTGFGCMGPAFAEGRAVATALNALAQQPDLADELDLMFSDRDEEFLAKS